MENINTTAYDVEQTRNEIRALLNTYPELGVNQGYVAALEQLPAGIIATARGYDPITAKAVLNKALEWKDKLLAEYPDLAQRPAQFAVALETPMAYLGDRSRGKEAAKEYAAMKGDVR